MKLPSGYVDRFPLRGSWKPWAQGEMPVGPYWDQEVLFADGTHGHAVWNETFWWGRDEKRGCHAKLNHAIAYRSFASTTITYP